LKYKIKFHPLVARDLDTIAQVIIEYAGPAVAARKLAEIEAATLTLQDTPHKGSTRDEIVPGLRAIPAGRKAVIAFGVDDDERAVFTYAITYTGADWIARMGARGRFLGFSEPRSPAYKS
jgi:toxin ParE1/3/4